MGFHHLIGVGIPHTPHQRQHPINAADARSIADDKRVLSNQGVGDRGYLLAGCCNSVLVLQYAATCRQVLIYKHTDKPHTHTHTQRACRPTTS